MLNTKTETEALALWCPMGRARWGEVAINRQGVDSAAKGTCCLASACAMWRWAAPANPPVASKKKAPPKPTRGFCGLAGPVV